MEHETEHTDEGGGIPARDTLDDNPSLSTEDLELRLQELKGRPRHGPASRGGRGEGRS